MLALTLLVASIALADSVNPSTLVPALWMAGAAKGHGLASFTLGVFAVYFAGGVVLVFGPGPALIRALHHTGGSIEHGLEAAGGIAVLVFAGILWRSRREAHAQAWLPDAHGAAAAPGPEEAGARESRSSASALALGVGIMAVELPTAFMYFGAISAILASHSLAPAEISLLLLYNALFVAPLVLLLAVRRLAGERADAWLAAATTWLGRAGRIVLTGVAGAGGTALLVLGLSGLLTA
jgi:cytochrome c biogenesis protein CcdA